MDPKWQTSSTVFSPLHLQLFKLDSTLGRSIPSKLCAIFFFISLFFFFLFFFLLITSYFHGEQFTEIEMELIPTESSISKYLFHFVCGCTLSKLIINKLQSGKTMRCLQQHSSMHLCICIFRAARDRWLLVIDADTRITIFNWAKFIKWKLFVIIYYCWEYQRCVERKERSENRGCYFESRNYSTFFFNVAGMEAESDIRYCGKRHR